MSNFFKSKLFLKERRKKCQMIEVFLRQQYPCINFTIPPSKNNLEIFLGQHHSIEC